MHEYPITQQIVKIAVESAEQQNARRINRITLVVGQLSGFVGESIQMYFDLVAQGTIAEGARVEIISVKPQLKCSGCGQLFYRRPMSFSCPECGQDGRPTEIGREFYLKDMEIEI